MTLRLDAEDAQALDTLSLLEKLSASDAARRAIRQHAAAVLNRGPEEAES
ncbi:CopG family transcriptional regulator [Deinococcus peraridilitoris]|uniref:Ribbon-helix-helix protein, copG family n=1 Tax=Deinococcus peraridilitoris (strain DSM 19664 / LMG 22246 / CIP 109416 / KR-200) TaxID=937777 RepID=L0A1A3_DEIPD|nr:CopG family transcriptional regulator [Deinococcus peraridilitoris]AFZ67601.1 Ribbon-helix-helix protein, copG family [Deinococcus peraridilitoris DSM 19664]